MSLEGQLEDLGLTDIIQILSLSRRSGELSIRRQQHENGYIIFSRGQIIFGSTPSVGPFGMTLVKKGMITQEILNQAVNSQKEHHLEKPIATILYELGVGKEILEKELRIHITAVVNELLSWKKGFFHFELGSPVDDSIILSNGMSAEYLLLEGARISDEKGKGGEEEPLEDELVPAVQEPSSPRAATFQDEIQKETSIGKTDQGGGKVLRKDLQLLNTMIDELSSPSSGGEVILLILRFASELLNRSLVFLVKKEEVWGWGQCGIVLTGKSPDEEIRKIKIPLSEDSIFKLIFNQKNNFKGKLEKNKWHSEVIGHLGGEWPGEVFVGPIMNEGRVIAFLYGDNLPLSREIGEVEGLETFLKIAGYAFGKMMVEKKGK